MDCPTVAAMTEPAPSVVVESPAALWAEPSGLDLAFAAFELAGAGVVVVDCERRLAAARGGVLARLGWQPEVILGRTLADALPAAHHERLAGGFAAALAGDRAACSLVTSDRLSVFDIQLGPIADRSSTVVGAIAVVREVASGEAGPGGEERLGLLLESVTDYAIFVLDVDGRVASWNEGARRLKGFEAAEIVGQHFSCFYTPEDLATGRPARQLEVAARDGRVEDEGWRVRKDGSRFWANVVISAIRDRAGELVGFGKVTRDTTARQSAERALRDSEARFRGLLDSAPDAIVIAGERGEVVLVNAQTEALFGYPREELIGRPVEMLLPERLGAAHRGHRAAFFAHPATRGMGEALELTAQHRDGHEFPVEISLSPLATDAGMLVSAAVRDITERKAAERMVSEQRELLSSVLASVTDYGIIGSDLEGKIDLFSRGAERMLGYRAEEVLGNTQVGLIDAGQIASRAAELGVAFGAEVLSHAARLGRNETREWTFVHEDGDRFTGRFTVSARRGADGEITGFIGVVTDVTEQRAAAEELRLAEERFRTAFTDAPVGIALVSAAPETLGRFLQVNRAMCELLGYTEDRLLRSDLNGFLVPEERARGLDAMSDLLAGRTDHDQSERRYVHSMGHPVDALVSFGLVRGADGSPLYFIVQADDISQRKRYERELQYMAGHDPLTGLANRSHLTEALDRHMAHVKRHGPAGALLMIDLDHFKQINDVNGHSAGDQALAAAARIIRARARDSDVVARLGGDEFIVLMTDGGEAEAQVLASDISDRIRRRVTAAAGADITLTASIGIRLCDNTGERAPEDLLAEVDEAMYTAKREGRNRIATHVTAAGSAHRQKARMTIHNQIERALTTDSFELYAQPVMRLHDHAITKHEVLLRMRTDDDQLLAPGTFLYVAERFEQIGRIDRWVVDHAIAIAAHPKLDPSIALEINLSGRSIGDPDLLRFIEARIDEHGVDPRRLIFEITETAAVENIHDARQFAEELGALGCRFALDDFGAGFGSFYYLKYIPFDFLKIDGEFIKSATEGRTDQLVVQSCVQLAKGLGKDTIAEFVENAETLRLIRALGVDHAQGYHIARPSPIAGALGLD